MIFTILFWYFLQNDISDFFSGFTLDLEITTSDFVRPMNAGDEDPTDLDAFPVVSISGPSSLQVNGPGREIGRKGGRERRDNGRGRSEREERVGEGGVREKGEREREGRGRRESGRGTDGEKRQREREGREERRESGRGRGEREGRVGEGWSFKGKVAVFRNV